MGISVMPSYMCTFIVWFSSNVVPSLKYYFSVQICHVEYIKIKKTSLY